MLLSIHANPFFVHVRGLAPALAKSMSHHAARASASMSITPNSPHPANASLPTLLIDAGKTTCVNLPYPLKASAPIATIPFPIATPVQLYSPPILLPANDLTGYQVVIVSNPTVLTTGMLDGIFTPPIMSLSNISTRVIVASSFATVNVYFTSPFVHSYAFA